MFRALTRVRAAQILDTEAMERNGMLDNIREWSLLECVHALRCIAHACSQQLRACAPARSALARVMRWCVAHTR